MLHINFDQDWPASLREIHVWTCKYLYVYIRKLFWRLTARNFKVTENQIQMCWWRQRQTADDDGRAKHTLDYQYAKAP